MNNGPHLPHSFAAAACLAIRVTRARGMVVVTEQNKTIGHPADAMSSSDTEDDFQEPATPTATQAEHSLALLPQQVSDLRYLSQGTYRLQVNTGESAGAREGNEPFGLPVL